MKEISPEGWTDMSISDYYQPQKFQCLLMFSITTEILTYSKLYIKEQTFLIKTHFFRFWHSYDLQLDAFINKENDI